MSNDGANTAAERAQRGVVTVVPLTSSVKRILPFQVLLARNDSGLTIDSKAQAEQVRSIAVERLGRKVGALPESIMTELEEALRLHLGL